MRLERLDARRCDGGENPLWDAAAQLRRYIDNGGAKVHSFDPLWDDTKTFEMPSVVTTLVGRHDGNAVVTLRSGIHFPDMTTGAPTLIHMSPKLHTTLPTERRTARRKAWRAACSSLRAWARAACPNRYSPADGILWRAGHEH